MLNLRCVSIASIALAGLLHLIIAPGHLSHAFPHGVFFILIGAAQLLWALAFGRYTAPMIYWAGFATSGSTISVWILAHLVSVPFGLTVHAIDPMTVVIICSELIGFVALIGLMERGEKVALVSTASGTFPRVIILTGGALVIALAFGVGVWGGGHMAGVIASDEAWGHRVESILGHGYGGDSDVDVANGHK